LDEEAAFDTDLRPVDSHGLYQRDWPTDSTGHRVEYLAYTLLVNSWDQMPGVSPHKWLQTTFSHFFNVLLFLKS
jgi:hypothetical protein